MPDVGLGQTDLVEQQRVMAALIEKQEGHATDQRTVTGEGQKALGIEGEIARKFLLADPHAGD